MIEQDYIVTDSRYHTDPEQAEVYFASSEIEEAIIVANEVGYNVGYNFVVVRRSDGQLMHDASLHADLPLEP